MATVKPMLAKDAVPEKLRFPLTVQAKLDGVRAIVKDGKVLSRSLKLIPNAEIQEALGRPEFEGLDGELIVGPPNAEDVFKKTTSYVRATSKTGGDWTFYVFDIWDEPSTPYRLRRAAMIERLELIKPSLTGRIQIVPEVIVDNATELENVEGELLAQGYEGAMVRDPIGTYKYGRSYPADGKLLKIKRYSDFEAEVIGVVEEQHNNNVAVTNALGRTERSSSQAGKVGKGTLGKLVLRGCEGSRWAGVEFGCGTGFSAQERADLWAEAAVEKLDGVARHGLEGRIAKVKFFEPGSDEAPRFPVFLGWRMEEDR